MTIIEKEYDASKVNFNALQKYIKENNNLKYIERFVDFTVCSNVYNYLGCTLVLTDVASVEDVDKLDKIMLKVVSDIDSQSKKVFEELENILLMK